MITRIAIIGIGAVADPIARAVSEIESAKLVAGSCRTRERGEKFVAKHGGAYYADYREMLDREKPDMAIVATPSAAHLEPVQECAQRGVHVLCEKPLEISVARIESMIAAADAGKIALGGIFPQRFNPVIETVRNAAAEGRFGSLAVVTAVVPWWREDSYYAPGRWQGTKAMDGGGALMNQAIHAVDYVQWIAAATMPDLDPEENPVTEVFAYTGNRGHAATTKIDVEDTGVAVLKFRNGAFGQLLGATSMWPGSHRRLTIAGRDGTVEVEEDQIVTWRFRDESPADEDIRQRFGTETSSAHGSSDPMAFPYVNHKRNIEQFLKAISGKQMPALSGREAGKAVQIIEACYTSAASGRPEKIMAMK
jgi:predicted dehydrogenase